MVAPNTDFIMDVLRPALSRAGATQSKDGWDLHCPMCVSRGETPDRKKRCRVFCSMASVGAWCFNCRFSTRYTLGKGLPRNLENLMTNLHVSQRDVLRVNHTARAIRSAMEQTSPSAPAVVQQYGVFPPAVLPPLSKPLEEWAADPQMATNEDLCRVIEYLGSRGPDIATAMTYYWSPDTKNDMHRRLIIPMYYAGKLAGWSARACDDGIGPKYLNRTPDSFLFNADVINDPNRRYILVFEGPMDAIATDAVSPLGSTLNPLRVRWLNDSDKIKIVVPDRDKAGTQKNTHGFIDVAVANDWHVAFPRYGDGKGFQNWWEHDVKDAAKAVERYGKLYVLRSLIESATNNKNEINFKRTRIL